MLGARDWSQCHNKLCGDGSDLQFKVIFTNTSRDDPTDANVKSNPRDHSTFLILIFLSMI